MDENMFKPGDVVRLKSGSPSLSVERCFRGTHGMMATVVWFDVNQSVRISTDLRVECLELYVEAEQKDTVRIADAATQTNHVDVERPSSVNFKV